MSAELQQRAVAWLEAWESLINACDYISAAKLFHEKVDSFGTLQGEMHGRTALVEQQWKKVWPQISNFKFMHPAFLLNEHGNEICVVVISAWSSQGRGGKRHGRATLVLKDEIGHLTCVHSHLSMEPGTVALT